MAAGSKLEARLGVTRCYRTEDPIPLLASLVLKGMHSGSVILCNETRVVSLALTA